MIDLRPAPFLLAGAIVIPLVLGLAVWGIDQYLDASNAKTKLLMSRSPPRRPRQSAISPTPTN